MGDDAEEVVLLIFGEIEVAGESFEASLGVILNGLGTAFKLLAAHRGVWIVRFRGEAFDLVARFQAER